MPLVFNTHFTDEGTEIGKEPVIWLLSSGFRPKQAGSRACMLTPVLRCFSNLHLKSQSEIVETYFKHAEVILPKIWDCFKIF